MLFHLSQHSFFEKGFPKTTGPELFNLTYIENALIQAGIESLSHYDVMATLNRFSAITIVDAVKRTIDNHAPISIYTSGGGMHNPLLMEHIQSMLTGCTFHSTEMLKINPDAKEAVLFAILANESVAGGNIQIGKTNSGIPSVSMGKISFPN